MSSKFYKLYTFVIGMEILLFALNIIIGTIFLFILKILDKDINNFILEWIVLVIGAMGVAKDSAIIVIFFTS